MKLYFLFIAGPWELNQHDEKIGKGEKNKTILHIFNSKSILDGVTTDNLPIGLFGDFYSHELTFFLVGNNDFKNVKKIFHQNNLNVKRLLFLGSSCIYPKFSKQPIKEEYLLSGELEKTNECYAIAKIAGLKLCESLRQQYNFDAISLYEYFPTYKSFATFHLSSNAFNSDGVHKSFKKFSASLFDLIFLIASFKFIGEGVYMY